jgi:hypothetical protein
MPCPSRILWQSPDLSFHATSNSTPQFATEIPDNCVYPCQSSQQVYQSQDHILKSMPVREASFSHGVLQSASIHVPSKVISVQEFSNCPLSHCEHLLLWVMAARENEKRLPAYPRLNSSRLRRSTPTQSPIWSAAGSQPPFPSPQNPSNA